ncbi:MAG: hypothetical protein HQL32_05620 [Planctomycetes bacterium]|nr:hypothetical protein [Planctomycetota bacterium]
MIFRLKLFIPLILIGGLFFGGLYLFQDSLLKMGLESSVPGLELDRAELEISSSSFGGNIKGQLKDEETAKVLLELGDSDLSIEPKPLGFGKVIVSRLMLEDLVIHRDLFSMVEDSAAGQSADDGVKSTTGPGQATTDEDGGLLDMDTSSLDYRDMLERVTGRSNLKVEEKIEQLQNTSKELEEKWKNLSKNSESLIDNKKTELDQLKKRWSKNGLQSEYKTEFESIKKEFKSLSSQKFDVKNLTQIANNVQKINDLKKRVKTLKNNLKEVKTKFNEDRQFFDKAKDEVQSTIDVAKSAPEDLKRLQRESKEVYAAADEDVDTLKEELNPKNFGAAKITRLLFGKEWEEKLNEYMGYWNQIKEYLPETGEGMSEEEKAEHESKKDVLKKEDYQVTFTRSPDYPSWAFKEIAYRGEAKEVQEGEDIGFEGTIHNMSSDEALLGQPISWALNGLMKGKSGGKFAAEGQYSTIHKEKETRYLNFKLEGKKIDKKTMGPPKMRVILTGGTMAINLRVDLSKNPDLTAEGELLIQNSDIQIAPTVKEVMQAPLKDAMVKMLSEAVSFTVSYKQGDKTPEVKFRNDLDDIFKGLLKESAQGFADQAVVKYQQQLQSKISSKIKNDELNTLISSLSGSLVGSGDQFISSLIQGKTQQQSSYNSLNQMDQEAGSLDGNMSKTTQSRASLQTTLKNEVKKRAEAEVRKRIAAEKKKLEDKAKAKLQAELKKRLALDTQRKNQAAKKKLADEKKAQEKKLQDQIKAKADEKIKKLEDKFKGLF